jgi:hypothetical protein
MRQSILSNVRVPLFTGLLVAATAWCAPAWAAPLAPEHVDAGAKWYGHTDLDAVRALPIVRESIDKITANTNKAAHIAEVAAKLGIDPLRDIKGVTLYSTQYKEGDGVALVYVREADSTKLEAALAAKHPDATSEAYGDRTLHTWTASGCHGQSRQVTGTIARSDLIIFAADAAEVRAALDVVDNKTAGLNADSPLVKSQAGNVLFSGRALSVPEEFRKTARCAAIRLLQAADVLWTEKDGQITGQYQLTMDTAEQAAASKGLLESFKAMALVRMGDLPAAKLVIDGINITADGATLSVTWNGTSADIQAGIRAVHEREAARRAAAAAPAPTETAK